MYKSRGVAVVSSKDERFGKKSFEVGDSDRCSDRGSTVVIEDCLVTKAFFVAANRHEKNVECAHVFVLQFKALLRQQEIRRPVKENGKTFHAALLYRIWLISFYFSKDQFNVAFVYLRVKLRADMFRELLLG